MRKQFILDKRTEKLLNEVASYRGGNRSLVIGEAIQVYSDREDRLEKIEADPAFQKMMEESDRAIREGRVTPMRRSSVRLGRLRSTAPRSANDADRLG